MFQVGRVKKRPRFEIAQVEDEVLVGRDFLRAHNCLIQFNPDVLIIRSVSEKELARESRDFLAEVELGEMAMKEDVPMSPVEKADETTADVATLAAWGRLQETYSDVLRGENAPLRAPPYRATMHRIPFTVPNRKEGKRIVYKFPERFVAAFNKICDAHVAAGIWVPATSHYADPMIPLMKSDGVTPRPVVDLRRRNLITEKMQMPVVDQDHITNRVAGARHVTIMDIEGAFQQIRIVDEDVHKTAFSTPRGIYYSTAAQQGDCNSTVSLHNAVADVVRGLTDVYHYADDLYVCSDDLDDHLKKVEQVLARFREHQFYLRKKKLKFCTRERDVLGRRIRDGEVSIHPSKSVSIASLKTPRNVKDLQSIIGVFGFCSRHIPNYAALLAPLTELTGNVPWRWSRTCQESFDELKRLAELNLHLSGIRDNELADRTTKPAHHPDPPEGYDAKNDAPGKYLFLFTDASLVGCGAALTVGTNWWNSRLVSLQSRKFNSAQANYPTHEAELQGVYEALKHWESKLLGRKFVVCTDNTALTSFMTSKKLNGRQARIWSYMSAFDFEIEYVKGERNVVADLLSRLHENDKKEKSARAQLSAMSSGRRNRRAPRRYDEEDFDVPKDLPDLVPLDEPVPPVVQLPRREPAKKPDRRQKEAAKNEKVRIARKDEEWEKPTQLEVDLDPEYRHDLDRALVNGYQSDPFFRKIWEKPEEFSDFRKLDRNEANEPLIYCVINQCYAMCVPDSRVRNRALREIFLEHAHEVLGHSGAKGTLEWLKKKVWWPSLTKDVEEYCKTCPSCQQTKPSNTLPSGKLHTLPIPSRPYQSVGIDFQGPLPPSKWGDETVTFLWNLVDRLTGECILIPCSEKGLTSKKCAEMYFRLVYPQWGLPDEFVCDQDVRWRSGFWRSFCKAVGTSLSMSSAYHPQSNGRIERLHRDLNQILKQFVSDSQEDWADAIPFAQFALNSRTSSTTTFSPFELSRLREPRNFPGFPALDASDQRPIRDLISEAQLRISRARDAIEKARVLQTSAANRKRKDDPIREDELNGLNDKGLPPPLLYVSSKNLHAVPSRARKLLPLFVGPFKVLAYSPRTSTYIIDLP
ncbi:hypothetical protein JCM11641_005352 [Rhodosporidiobolus odoratus]